MKSSTIKIKGMHCSSCEELIRDALLDLDGIGKVDISHQKGLAVVSYDESKVNEKTIKTAITAEGYKVE
ncbi:MAG: heavy-metal-associated domain-containing protein [Candidatus Woesearchaeota archaeon]